MIKLFLFFLILSLSLRTFSSENSLMFSCKTKNFPQAELIIDTVFNSQFNIYTKENAYGCSLGIKMLDYIPRSVVPSLTIEYERGECSEELPKDLLVLDRMNISMRLFNSKKPKASLQWKIGEGSFDCELTKFDDFAFYNLLERWRKDPAQRKIDSLKDKKPEKPKRK